MGCVPDAHGTNAVHHLSRCNSSGIHRFSLSFLIINFYSLLDLDKVSKINSNSQRCHRNLGAVQEGGRVSPTTRRRFVWGKVVVFVAHQSSRIISMKLICFIRRFVLISPFVRHILQLFCLIVGFFKETVPCSLLFFIIFRTVITTNFMVH